MKMENRASRGKQNGADVDVINSKKKRWPVGHRLVSENSVSTYFKGETELVRPVGSREVPPLPVNQACLP